MIGAFFAGRFASIGMFSLGDVRLHSDDRLNPGSLHLVVKRDRTVEISVVGYGYGARSKFLCSLCKRFDLDCAVEKTEVRVKMEVHEVFFVHFLLCVLRSQRSQEAWAQFWSEPAFNRDRYMNNTMFLRTRSLAQRNHGVYRNL